MHQTLFTIGNLNIPTYTVLLDLGLILGLVLTYFEGKRWLESAETALDLGLWTVIGGILGGRIGYVWANWSTFAEDWVQALQIWKGGLAFHGAFFGGLLVMAVFALLRRRRPEKGGGLLYMLELGDVLTPGLGLGLVFGWAACLMGGCAYGIYGEGFGYAVLPDINGVEASRFATQAVGLIFAFVLLVVFWFLRGRWPFSGAAFLMFNLLYFTGQFFLEFSRGDPARYLGPWRLAQVLNLILALSAAAGLMGLWWKSRGGEVEEFEEVEDEEAEEAIEAKASVSETEASGTEVSETEVSGVEEAEGLEEETEEAVELEVIEAPEEDEPEASEDEGEEPVAEG